MKFLRIMHWVAQYMVKFENLEKENKTEMHVKEIEMTYIFWYY